MKVVVRYYPYRVIKLTRNQRKKNEENQNNVINDIPTYTYIYFVIKYNKIFLAC